MLIQNMYHVWGRDVRNRFFNFSSVLEKNSDSVRNEFGSVRFAKTFSVRIVIKTDVG